MIDRVELGDVARQVAAYRDFKITHAELVEWARVAMTAQSIPPSQVDQVMDMLLDISTSSPVSMNAALKNYEKWTQPLF